MAEGILLCSPKYAGLSVSHQRAARRLELWCASKGLKFDAIDACNAPVDAARDMLAAAFLKSDGFDRMLMVDAGIGFEVATVEHLLTAVDKGRDFVAAAAPLRSTSTRRALDLAAKGMDAELAELNAANFVIDFAPKPGDPSRVIIEDIDGNLFVQTRRIGGACLMLTRTVFESISEKFPELQDDNGWFSYFLPAVIDRRVIDPDDPSAKRERCGEDVAFCLRWRACGGQIWTSLNEPLTHEGHAIFTGNLAASFGMVGDDR